MKLDLLFVIHCPGRNRAEIIKQNLVKHEPAPILQMCNARHECSFDLHTSCDMTPQAEFEPPETQRQVLKGTSSSLKSLGTPLFQFNPLDEHGVRFPTSAPCYLAGLHAKPKRPGTRRGWSKQLMLQNTVYIDLTSSIASCPEWSLARPSLHGYTTVPLNFRLCRRPAHKSTRPASDRRTGGDICDPNERRLYFHCFVDPAGTRL